MIWVAGNCSIPVIAIPHLHPGFNSRTRLPDIQHRVYWLCWAATWVYLDSAVKALHNAAGSNVDRLSLCRTIIDLAEDRLKEAGFYEIFSIAKTTLSSVWNSTTLKHSKEWKVEMKKRKIEVKDRREKEKQEKRDAQKPEREIKQRERQERKRQEKEGQKRERQEKKRQEREESKRQEGDIRRREREIKQRERQERKRQEKERQKRERQEKKRQEKEESKRQEGDIRRREREIKQRERQERKEKKRQERDIKRREREVKPRERQKRKEKKRQEGDIERREGEIKQREREEGERRRAIRKKEEQARNRVLDIHLKRAKRRLLGDGRSVEVGSELAADLESLENLQTGPTNNSTGEDDQNYMDLDDKSTVAGTEQTISITPALQEIGPNPKVASDSHFLPKIHPNSSTDLEEPHHSTSGAESINDNGQEDSHQAMSNTSQRAFHLSDYLATLERCRRANGPPHSNERLLQAERLFQTEIPGLYNRTDYTAWVNFILEQPENYWLAGCLESWEGVEEMPAEKLTWFLESGQGYNDKAWIQDFSNRRDTLQRASDELMSKQSEWIRRRGQKRFIPSLDCLNGSLVHITQRGEVTIKYQKAEGDLNTIRIKMGPSVAPLGYLDSRTIHFIPDGIDIRDHQGVTLFLRGKRQSATLPLLKLADYASGSKLISLWEEITGLVAPPNIISTRVSEQLHLPAVEKKGRPIPTKMPGPEELNNPPSEEDALWLLNEYLNQYFPEGGKFWAGSQEYFPKGTGDGNRFIR